MRVGDRLHDGEPKADALVVASAIGATPLKGLEESADLIKLDHGTGVGDREDRSSGPHPGAHLDVAVRHVVTLGVVDEIGNKALEQARRP